MTNLNQTESNLKSFLTGILNVNKWDTIQFSMLPTDPALGYLQLVEVNYGALTQSQWLVGIGIAGITLDNLKDQIYSMLDAIETNFYYPSPCLADGSSLLITSGVQVEIPDTYANQSGLSETTGFKTAITFQITVSKAR